VGSGGCGGWAVGVGEGVGWDIEEETKLRLAKAQLFCKI